MEANKFKLFKQFIIDESNKNCPGNTVIEKDNIKDCHCFFDLCNIFKEKFDWYCNTCLTPDVIKKYEKEFSENNIYTIKDISKANLLLHLTCDYNKKYILQDMPYIHNDKAPLIKTFYYATIVFLNNNTLEYTNVKHSSVFD